MIWYVAIGGALGSVARFLLGELIQQRTGSSFPIGTLVVNISGSLLLGFLLEYSLGSPGVSRETRALLTTGFCGGYTTFSAFSFEMARLLQGGDYRRALVYVGLSVVLSVAGCFAGIGVGRALIAIRPPA